MSKSSLVNVNVPAYEGNYTKGRSGRKIEAITIHHMAGRLTAEQCGKIFQKVGRYGSSHYGIGYDGRIGQYVDESDTAWTNSNWDSNCKSVTIETSDNDNSWYVNDVTLNSLIKLVADIAKRNKLGTLVKGKNVTWHSMFTSTSCPGAYLLSKMDYIIEKANKINSRPVAKPNVIYQTHDKVAHKYWSEIINFNNYNSNGYAGYIGHAMDGLKVRLSNGAKVYYQAHIKGGTWLPVVSKWDNTASGYAGIYNKDIDGISMRAEGCTLKYRVHLLNGGWLDWVSKMDINDSVHGMAGIYGRTIDAIQIQVI